MTSPQNEISTDQNIVQRKLGDILRRLVRWIDMALAPKPGQVLSLRPGSWNPEAALDSRFITLHHQGFPRWKDLQTYTYTSYVKANLPTHWVVVEKRWHPEAHEVFIRLVSMGEENDNGRSEAPVLGWCQYRYENFDWVSFEDTKPPKKKPE